LMGWLLEKYPDRDTSEVLAGFTALVFHRDFQATFTDGTRHTYDTADGEIKASPLTLVST